MANVYGHGIGKVAYKLQDGGEVMGSAYGFTPEEISRAKPLSQVALSLSNIFDPRRRPILTPEEVIETPGLRETDDPRIFMDEEGNVVRAPRAFDPETGIRSYFIQDPETGVGTLREVVPPVYGEAEKSFSNTGIARALAGTGEYFGELLNPETRLEALKSAGRLAVGFGEGLQNQMDAIGHTALLNLGAGQNQKFEGIDVNGQITMANPELFAAEIAAGGLGLSKFIPNPTGKGSGVALGMFAGVNAKTADMAAHSRAVKMKEAGRGRQAIWDQTGWFQGADGKWRFEIDDSGSKMSDAVLEANNVGGTTAYHGRKKPGYTGTYGDALVHPELLAAYPALAEIPTAVKWTRSSSGRYQPVLKEIEVRGPSRHPQRSVALHEGMHGIQDLEKYAVGGNPDSALNFIKSSISVELSRISKQIDALREERFLPGIRTKGEKEALNAKIRELDAEYESVLRYRHSLGLSKLTGEKAYNQLAGEVEARNVQTRMNMSPETRRERPPWETEEFPSSKQALTFDYPSQIVPRETPKPPKAFSTGVPTALPESWSVPAWHAKALSELPEDLAKRPEWSIGEESLGWTQDNPALHRGDIEWLRSKHRERERMEEKADFGSASYNGVFGSQTAGLGQKGELWVDPKKIALLDGASSEIRFPGEMQYDSLMKKVTEEGWDPNAANKVVVSVNHRGVPFIVEGNTRAAVARDLGIDKIAVEVRYFNGGELQGGSWAPHLVTGKAEPPPLPMDKDLPGLGMRDGGVVRDPGVYEQGIGRLAYKLQDGGTIPGIMGALNRPVPHTARAGEPYTVGRKSGPFAGGTLLAAQIAEVLGKGMWQAGKAIGSATDQAVNYGNFGPIMQEAPFAMMGATGAPLVSRGLRGPPTDGSMVASSLGRRPPDPPPNPRAVIGHNQPPKPTRPNHKPFDPNEPRPPSDPTMPFWSAAFEYAMALEGTHTAQTLAERVLADQQLRAPDKAVLLQTLRTYGDAEKVSPANLALETKKHENMDWKITSTAPIENMPHMSADNPVGSDEMGAVQLSIPKTPRAMEIEEARPKLINLRRALDRAAKYEATGHWQGKVDEAWEDLSQVLDDDTYNSLVSNIKSIPGYRERISLGAAWDRFRNPYRGEEYDYIKARQKMEDEMWEEGSHTWEETRARRLTRDSPGVANMKAGKEELLKMFPGGGAGIDSFRRNRTTDFTLLHDEMLDAFETRYGTLDSYNEKVSEQIEKVMDNFPADEQYISKKHRPPIHSSDVDHNTLAFARTSQVPVKIPAGANKNRRVHNTQGTYHHELQWDYLKDLRNAEKVWSTQSKVPSLWPGVSKEGLRLQQQQIKAVIYAGVQNGQRTFVFRRPVSADGNKPKVYAATKKNIEKALKDLGPEFKLIEAKSKLVDEDGVESWVMRPTVVVEEGVEDIYQRLLDRGIRRSVAIPVPSLGEKPDEEDELLLPEHLRLSEDGDVGRVSRETIPGSRTTVFSTGVPTALPRVR